MFNRKTFQSTCTQAVQTLVKLTTGVCTAYVHVGLKQLPVKYIFTTAKVISHTTEMVVVQNPMAVSHSKLLIQWYYSTI